MADVKTDGVVPSSGGALPTSSGGAPLQEIMMGSKFSDYLFVPNKGGKLPKNTGTESEAVEQDDANDKEAGEQEAGKATAALIMDSMYREPEDFKGPKDKSAGLSKSYVCQQTYDLESSAL